MGGVVIRGVGFVGYVLNCGVWVGEGDVDGGFIVRDEEICEIL